MLRLTDGTIWVNVAANTTEITNTVKQNYCFFCFTVLLSLISSLGYTAEEVRYNDLKPGLIEASIYAGMGSNFRFPAATRNVFKFDIIGVRVSRSMSPRTAIGIDLATGTGNLDGGSPNVWSTVCFQQYLHTNSDNALTFDLSIGLMRFKNQVPELGTRTNFTERLGFTYKWKKSDEAAWSVQWTLSHISNAGIRLPNIGINTCSVVLGHCWYR